MKKNNCTFIGNASKYIPRTPPAVYCDQPITDPTLKRSIQVLEKSDLDIAAELLTKRYRRQISNYQQRINATLKPLYGKKIHFSTQEVSKIVNKIYYIIDNTGENIDVVAEEIRKYTGKNLRFFRREGLREVPIDPCRIVQAYKAVKRKEPIAKVKAILFR